MCNMHQWPGSLKNWWLSKSKNAHIFTASTVNQQQSKIGEKWSLMWDRPLCTMSSANDVQFCVLFHMPRRRKKCLFYVLLEELNNVMCVNIQYVLLSIAYWWWYWNFTPAANIHTQRNNSYKKIQVRQMWMSKYLE